MYLSDNAYLVIKPESSAGTAVIPTIAVPLVSESVKTVVNHTADRRMKGLDWKADDLLRGGRSHEGDIVVLGDASVLAHFLNMVMLKGSTTTGGSPTAYTHPFTVGSPKTYTFEIKKGLYAQRYFGVYVDTLKLDFADGQLQITATIKAMGQFSVASLGVALSGSSTSLTLDDEYDLAPNRGLVANDVIVVGGTEITVGSVNANGVGVGFSSTSVTASAGDPVYLKPQSPSLPTATDPFYFGNLLVGFGADASAAATAAGAIATATPIYDLSITIKNNLFAQNGTGRFDPVFIGTRTKEAQIALKQLFQSVAQRQKFQDRVKQAIVITGSGKNIASDFSTKRAFTLTFNNVKQTDHDNALTVGDYIMDDQTFEVLYDGSDAAAMSASVVNTSAGTVY